MSLKWITLKRNKLVTISLCKALLEEIAIFMIISVIITLAALWKVTESITSTEQIILGVSSLLIWLVLGVPTLYRKCKITFNSSMSIEGYNTKFILTSILLETFIICCAYYFMCIGSYNKAILFSLPVSILTYLSVIMLRWVMLYGDTNRHYINWKLKFNPTYIDKIGHITQFAAINCDEVENSDERYVSAKSGVSINVAGKSENIIIDLTENEIFYENEFIIIKPIKEGLATVIPVDKYVSTQIEYLNGDKVIKMEKQNIYK